MITRDEALDLLIAVRETLCRCAASLSTVGGGYLWTVADHVSDEIDQLVAQGSVDGAGAYTPLTNPFWVRTHEGARMLGILKDIASIFSRDSDLSRSVARLIALLTATRSGQRASQDGASDGTSVCGTSGIRNAQLPEIAHRLSDAPETMRTTSGGAEIELLVWGEVGKPGLLLVHGAGAHAHWWDGIAPFLAETHRVAAISLPGNGGSQWCPRYSSAAIVGAALACIDAASLSHSGPPVVIGHSMGGAHLMHAAIHTPDALRGLVLLDTSFRAPRRSLKTRKSRRTFASESDALEHFRLAPPGVARDGQLVSHVARHAIERIMPTDGPPVWTWRADPNYWNKFEAGIEQGPYDRPLEPRVPAVLMIAALSHVATMVKSLPLGSEVRRIILPDCGHHAMLDRPLALACALRSLLAVWPS